MGAEHTFLPAFIHGEKISIDLSFRDLYAIQRIHLFHLFFSESYCGNQAQIIQLILFQVFLSRFHHHGFGHRQPHKKTNSQRHNGQYRHITPQALPNFPQSRLNHGRFHADALLSGSLPFTIRSLLRAQSFHSSPCSGLYRSSPV